jgi:hypothetical protein
MTVCIFLQLSCELQVWIDFSVNAVLKTDIALRLEYIVLRSDAEEPCGRQLIWYVLHGKAVLTVLTAYTEPMSFVSMLTGAPTCNVFHLKLRDEKKDVTNSSRIELHHHSSTMHKGLLLTFHQTGLGSLLLKHYKTITTYAYDMCDIPPFFLSSLFLSSTFLCICCHNTELLYMYHPSKALYSFSFMLSSCLSSSSSKVYFSFYLYLNSMLVSSDILLFTILQAHS